MIRYQRYQNFSVEDFVEDEKFLIWALTPTPSTDEYWEGFLVQYPQKSTCVYDARTLIQSLQNHYEKTKVPEKNHTSFFDSLKQNMDDSKKISAQSAKKKNRGVYMAVMASLLILSASVSLFWFSADQQKRDQIYITGANEIKIIELPDNSIVKLNKKSQLTVSDDWPEGLTRKVWLKGEAFFKVEDKYSSQIKFQVITDDVVVEVYGTQFNVLTDQNHTEVFLENGNLQLYVDDKKEQIVPGQLITYTSSDKKIKKLIPEVLRSKFSWKDEAFEFKEQEAVEILKQIGIIFNVQIELQNETMSGQHNTIRIPKERLDIAIPILERSLNIKIVENEGLLIVN